MEKQIEFRTRENAIEMWCERDKAPFDDFLMGLFRRNDEGYYVFCPSANVVMYCQHLRVAMQKASELNLPSDNSLRQERY